MHETFRVLAGQREADLAREAVTRHLAANARTRRAPRARIGTTARTIALAVVRHLTA